MPTQIVTRQNDQGRWEATFTVQLKGKTGPRSLKAVGDKGTTEDDIIKIATRQMEVASQSNEKQWNKLFTQGKARVTLGKWGRQKKDVLMWYDPARKDDIVPLVLGSQDGKGRNGPAAAKITEITRPYFGLKIRASEIEREVDDKEFARQQRRMERDHLFQTTIVPDPLSDADDAGLTESSSGGDSDLYD